MGGNQTVIPSSDDKNCDNEVLRNCLSGFGDSFKISIGNWKCDSCCVTNCERDLKFIACETSRVGISNSTSSDTRKWSCQTMVGCLEEVTVTWIQ